MKNLFLNCFMRLAAIWMHYREDFQKKELTPALAVSIATPAKYGTSAKMAAGGSLFCLRESTQFLAFRHQHQKNSAFFSC